jgi:hypothetical protein
LARPRRRLTFRTAELYLLDLDSHSHGLGEEILDIRRGPEIEALAA